MGFDICIGLKKQEFTDVSLKKHTSCIPQRTESLSRHIRKLNLFSLRGHFHALKPPRNQPVQHHRQHVGQTAAVQHQLISVRSGRLHQPTHTWKSLSHWGSRGRGTDVGLICLVLKLQQGCFHPQRFITPPLCVVAPRLVSCPPLLPRFLGLQNRSDEARSGVTSQTRLIVADPIIFPGLNS